MQNKKFRVNILDFLIVAMVILCVAGAFLRMYAKSNDDKLEAQTATVSFLIQDVQSESQYAFNEGDVLYCYELECELGTLVGEVDPENAVYYDAIESGEIRKSTSQGLRVDIKGQFTCEGTMTESGFAVNGTKYIAPNKSLYVAFPNIKAQILITEIELN